MAKILVISDTHHNINNAIELIEKINPEYIIHLGDMIIDCEDLLSIFPRKKFIFVKGNNDLFNNDPLFPYERCFTLYNKRFFICHGHTYNVKRDLSLLLRKAKNENCDIVLFGHTHKAFIQKSPFIILNPGSYSSYGIIDIDNDKISANVFDFQGDN